MRQEHQLHMNIEALPNLPLERGDLFILLDGASLPALQMIYQHDDEPLVDQLYRGTRHQAALEVSPSLYWPSPRSRFWNIQEQWRHAGIVVTSDSSFETLASHLRSLLSVRMPSGQLAYCRFYTPTWLKRYCASLSEDELSAWLGPINSCMFHTTHTADASWGRFAASQKAPARQAEHEGWFQLRPEQLDDWLQEERQRFIERMVQHFASGSLYPDDGTLEVTIEQRVAQAEQAGLQLEYQVTRFLELALQFPAEIDTPSNRYLLDDKAQPADHRLEQLEARLFGL